MKFRKKGGLFCRNDVLKRNVINVSRLGKDTVTDTDHSYSLAPYFELLNDVANVNKNTDTAESSLDSRPTHVDLNHVLYNETVVALDDEEQDPVPTNVLSLSDSRVIIDLGYFFEKLVCTMCSARLHASENMALRPVGLAGFVTMQCTKCLFINNVPLGKQHRTGIAGPAVFDVNTKLALACIHAGIGTEQANNFLSALNIQPVNVKTVKKRERELDSSIQCVTDECVGKALEAEKNATTMATGVNAVTLSTDGAWQSRGSGRSYRSSSGHATAIGHITKKCVGYSWRSKVCRICSVARRRGVPARLHACVLNWSGSSKAMEPDMICEIVKNVEKNGMVVASIVGDEDTTTISRLRKEVGSHVTKLSDMNHLKKTLGNHLYELRKSCKALSPMVISYLQKLYSYNIRQNQGNPADLSSGLMNIVSHVFGTHDHCDDKWCGYKRNPTGYRFKSLPYGKALSGDLLHKSLDKLFSKQAEQADKLSCVGSTQANESLNMSISSKAPKTKHFSESSSLVHRIQAGVAQKNIGYKYVAAVLKDAGLSPGKQTLKHAARIDHQRRYAHTKASSREGKRNRLKRKKLRLQVESTNELREGPTYMSNIGMDQEVDLTEIPAPIPTPLPTTVSAVDVITSEQVVFDLETTGLGFRPDIIQIAASRSNETSYNAYIIPPQGHIPAKITSLTGLSVHGKDMYFKGQKVAVVTMKEAIQGFIDFLYPNTILVGHNSKAFDNRILLIHLMELGLVKCFQDKVVGFTDTLPLTKSLYPDRKDRGYKQEVLVADMLNITYDSHNALGDVTSLQKLMHRMDPSPGVLSQHTITMKSTFESVRHKIQTKANKMSLQVIVADKILSDCMATKVAASGLCMEHLRLAFKRDGLDGVKHLFSDTVAWGGVRVTKNSSIIHKVVDYLETK